MNNQLIEKIITSNNLQCPVFTYENPVLDRNVAKILSKSFVKIFNLSRQNSKVNNNLRLTILENIRKMCQVEPENHIKIDENFTALLLEFYDQNIKDLRLGNIDSTEKELDAFLIRNFKDMNLNSSQYSTSNPEIIQALINLNQNGRNLDSLMKDIIYWNSRKNKNIHILKDLWTNDNTNTNPSALEDISVKLKPEIEKYVLEICQSILKEKDLNIEEMFISNTCLKNIVEKCACSANCFQICCGVLNYLFVMTNFDIKLQTFVQVFVKNVGENCSCNTFSTLYPTRLSHIVVLLDISLSELPEFLQNSYIESAKKYLTELESKSRNDFIMLLSHFPQWFDIYFEM